ncbi:hypothetical protein C2S52_012569 [Perilla frutescens var. hirtella]|nr:hypothetical protein C2S52_012569 [Perilla frutescens var. hirtella]
MARCTPVLEHSMLESSCVRALQMAPRNIVVCHGGIWKNKIYENGTESYIFVPPSVVTPDDADEDDICCRRATEIVTPSEISHNDEEDLQDDTWEETNAHGRQWIITGALYQASIPFDKVGVEVNSRDKLCEGATFMSKEEMITALGLYHLVNHVDYRAERSSTTRFGVVCKHKDHCAFFMRATAHGTVWRVIKWNAPHTCQIDLTRHSPPMVSSKNWGAHVVSMFRRAANCYRAQDFEKYMNHLFLASENGAYKKLLDADPMRWARSKCVVRRYGFMTSNCAECFNGRLRWARRLPVCTLLECVRTLIGHWFSERRKNALARTHELTEELDLDLIPCAHAVAALSKSNHVVSSYVSSYYTTQTLRGMYSAEVMPILHPDDWDVPFEVSTRVVLTPSNPRQAGRPRTSRISSSAQSSSRSNSRVKVCSRCQQTGHNRATCTEVIPLSQGSHIDSNNVNQASSSRTRRPKHCSICHEIGHTRVKCPQRSTG